MLQKGATKKKGSDKMQFSIPKELLPYVRMSQHGLILRTDIPPELQELYEKTRGEIEKMQENRRSALEDLIK